MEHRGTCYLPSQSPAWQARKLPLGIAVGREQSPHLLRLEVLGTEADTYLTNEKELRSVFFAENVLRKCVSSMQIQAPEENLVLLSGWIHFHRVTLLLPAHTCFSGMAPVSPKVGRGRACL